MTKVWQGCAIAFPLQYRVILASATIIAGQVFLFLPAIAQSLQDGCIHSPNASVRLSRAQLSELLQLRPPTDENRAIAIVGNYSYCQLRDVPDVSGVPTRRYAFPLEADPETWIVLLFQGERYLGYDFKLGNSQMVMFVKSYIHQLRGGGLSG